MAKIYALVRRTCTPFSPPICGRTVVFTLNRERVGPKIKIQRQRPKHKCKNMGISTGFRSVNDISVSNGTMITVSLGKTRKTDGNRIVRPNIILYNTNGRLVDRLLRDAVIVRVPICQKVGNYFKIMIFLFVSNFLVTYICRRSFGVRRMRMNRIAFVPSTHPFISNNSVGSSAEVVNVAYTRIVEPADTRLKPPSFQTDRSGKYTDR